MAEIVPLRFVELDLLHPLAVEAFVNLRDSLSADYTMGKIDVLFKPFETYRTPVRQRTLYKQGKTKADAYRSAHQYGLAVDFVPTVGGHWTWDVDTKAWDWLRSRAHGWGLINELSWDRAHVEHPLWRIARAAMF